MSLDAAAMRQQIQLIGGLVNIKKTSLASGGTMEMRYLSVAMEQEPIHVSYPVCRAQAPYKRLVVVSSLS